MVASFNETRAPTSRKYVAEQGIVMLNWSKTFQFFWFHSFVFPLEKQRINRDFHSFFISKKILGDYFRGNACTHFQKICIWFRHDHSKFIRDTSKFWSHSSIFALEEQPQNLNFCSFLISFLVALLHFCFRKTTC